MAQPIARNKRARFKFDVLEEVEAGIALVGTEVKSLRDRQVDFSDSYVRIDGGQATIHKLHIKPYALAAAQFNHDPMRIRKLLLHKRQLQRLTGQLNERGLTLIPLALYFNDRGLAKVELALARGRTQADKRQSMKKRASDREIAREMARRRRGR